MNEEDEAFEDLAKRQGYWGLQGSRKHQILRFAENVERKGTSMTPQQIEALKLALMALITITDAIYVNSQQEADAVYKANDAITAIKEALAHCPDCGQLLGDAGHIHTCSPQRTWVGLTGIDQKELMAMSARDAVFATEAKLKEKNT